MSLNNVNNLLILRLSSLGDILLTTPFLRAIKKNYPGIKIDYLLKEQYKDLVSYNPYVEKLFLYSKEDNLIDKLKQRKYDLLVDLQNNFRSAEIQKKIGVKRVKFRKRTVDKFLLVNFKINKLRDAGQIPVRYSKVLSEIELDDKGLDIFFPDEIKHTLPFDSKNIGFAPGARHFTKMWPKENYITLGKRLAERGYKIILFGGKSDRVICKDISNAIPGSLDLSNDDNILQTAADMKVCTAVVCNDSGLMHTACAVKVPVMAFFGSTVREFGFTPYNNPNKILENEKLSCRPCTHIGRESCPKGHFRCMLELTPALAMDNLLALLK